MIKKVVNNEFSAEDLLDTSKTFEEILVFISEKIKDMPLDKRVLFLERLFFSFFLSDVTMRCTVELDFNKLSLDQFLDHRKESAKNIFENYEKNTLLVRSTKMIIFDYFFKDVNTNTESSN